MCVEAGIAVLRPGQSDWREVINIGCAFEGFTLVHDVGEERLSLRALSGRIELFAVGLFALVSHEGLQLDGRGPPGCSDTRLKRKSLQSTARL